MAERGHSCHPPSDRCPISGPGPRTTVAGLSLRRFPPLECSGDHWVAGTGRLQTVQVPWGSPSGKSSPALLCPCRVAASPVPSPEGTASTPRLSSQDLRKLGEDWGRGLRVLHSLEGFFLCTLNRCAVRSFKFDTFLFLNLKKAQ